MKKVFGFIALALAFAACGQLNETPVQPNENEVAQGITITAQLAPKDALTKALAVDGDKIKSSWAVNEHIAILYEVSGDKKVADATIKSVSGSGTATFQFTVDNNTPDNTPCTIVYPLSAAKDDHSGVKAALDILGTQDGSLNPDLDVRVGEGTIHTETPSLDITTQPEPQFAIFKFTTGSVLSGLVVKMKWLHITVSQYMYTILLDPAASTFYAFLPPPDPDPAYNQVSFEAKGDDDVLYTRSKSGVIYEAGNYYESTIRMYETNGRNESSAYFTFNVDKLDYTTTPINIVGTSIYSTYGLEIAQGNSITVKSLAGQIITRVDFYTDWYQGMEDAELTSSTAGTVHWKKDTKFGSVEGINATSFVLSNGSSSSSVMIGKMVVYYLPAPKDDSNYTNTSGTTLYESSHFRIIGTATSDYIDKEDEDKVKYGLRIDNHLSQQSITIESKNGEIITGVRLRCPCNAIVAENTSSTAGTVRWKYKEKFGYIDGVNATSLTITNSADLIVLIDHLLVYYYE